jgi:hypothetical protein
MHTFQLQLLPDSLLKHTVLTKRISNKASKRGLVQVSSGEHLSNAVWILLSSFGATDTKPMEDFFRGMYIPLDCEFLVAHRPNSDVIISEVYHLDRHLPLNRNYFGTWRHGLGVTMTNISFMERRNDLQGFVMKVASMTVSNVSEIKKDFTRFGTLIFIEGKVSKVKLSPLQALEAYRVVRC